MCQPYSNWIELAEVAVEDDEGEAKSTLLLYDDEHYVLFLLLIDLCGLVVFKYGSINYLHCS